MSSTFMGISIATRGLYSSQVALSVTSNNISNTNTEGYSRQTVSQTSVSGVTVSGGSAIIGGGSEVTAVTQIHDASLDKKYWQANSTLGEWQVKSDSLTEIESVLGDSNDGFSTVMDDFYAALEDLSNDASDSSVRTSVLETANSLCEYLNNASNQLTSLRSDLNTSVKTTVDQINSYARQLAALNDQIQQAASTGATTNELEDQRTVLLDNLSKLTAVTVSQTVVGTNADGSNNTMLTVSVNGETLVNGNDYRQLECYETSDGMYGIRWQDTQDTFEPAGGQLQGYLDLRDGTGTDSDYKGIPYYISQLDKFARTFAEAFNEGVYADGNTYYAGHAGGYGADGSTGIRFFTYDDSSSADFMDSGIDLDSRYANITAASISVSKDIQEDVDKIAASSSADEADNNENVADLIKLCEDSQMFNKGTPEDFMDSIIASLGTNSSYAQRMADYKSTIVKNISDRRTSVSGVSIDEETANLTKYQQSYNAAATLVTTWNEIYQATIDMVNE